MCCFIFFSSWYPHIDPKLPWNAFFLFAKQWICILVKKQNKTNKKTLKNVLWMNNLYFSADFLLVKTYLACKGSWMENQASRFHSWRFVPWSNSIKPAPSLMSAKDLTEKQPSQSKSHSPQNSTKGIVTSKQQTKETSTFHRITAEITDFTVCHTSVTVTHLLQRGISWNGSEHFREKHVSNWTEVRSEFQEGTATKPFPETQRFWMIFCRLVVSNLFHAMNQFREYFYRSACTRLRWAYGTFSFCF